MSINEPLFTVATITYNSGKWVRQAIESVLASTFTDFEFLISDDCSTDDTWEIIQEYNDPRIRSWRNETNIGEYPNRNKVLSKATGEYFIYIDGDDLIYPYGLEILYHYMKLFPDAAMGYCIPPRPYYILPVYLNSREIFLQDYFGDSISHHGFTYTIFKTVTLKNAGGLSEKYKFGDTFIKKKISSTNSVVLIPEGLTWWRVSQNQASILANKKISGIIESFHINVRVLEDIDCPLSLNERRLATCILKKRFLIQNVIKKTVKLKFLFAWNIFKKSGLKIDDFKCLFSSSDIYTQSHSRYNPQSNFSKLNEWNKI